MKIILPFYLANLDQVESVNTVLEEYNEAVEEYSTSLEDLGSNRSEMEEKANEAVSTLESLELFVQSEELDDKQEEVASKVVDGIRHLVEDVKKTVANNINESDSCSLATLGESKLVFHSKEFLSKLEETKLKIIDFLRKEGATDEEIDALVS